MRRISTRIALATAALSVVAAIASSPALAQDEPAQETNGTLPMTPAVSPDGKTVVFAYHGDLWTVPIDGGNATRVSAHPASEQAPRFNADGSKIAFTSDRLGRPSLYTMNPDGTGLTEVLTVDRAALLSDFADDGNLYFTGYLEHDVYRNPRSYKVNAEGGVHERAFDAFGRSPDEENDGDRVLFVRGNFSWDRRHYRGPDSRDVWMYDPDGDDQFVQLTSWEGNDGMPRWTTGGKFVYASDQNDRTVNLYLADTADGEDAQANAKRLTFFQDNDVVSFDVTPDGKTLVFHQWDKLYKLDLTQDGAEPTEISITAAEDADDNYKLVAVDSRVSEAALSPNKKAMAMVAYGQVYVRGLEDNSITRRVSTTPAHYKEVAWSPDGGTLYFVGNDSGRDAIYAATVELTRDEIKKAIQGEDDDKSAEQAVDEIVEEGAAMDEDAPATQPATQPADDEATTQPAAEAEGDDKAEEEKKEDEVLPPGSPDPEKWDDAVKFRIELVSESDAGDSAPVPSPDGKKLAFHRGVGDVMVLDLETGDETVVYDGWIDASVLWYPDNKHLLYNSTNYNFNADVWAVAIDGESEPVNLTRHPDNDGDMALSADGRILAFVSERVAEENDVWMVYLDESLEALAPSELADYYKAQAEAVKKLKPIDVPEFAKKRGSVSPKVEMPTTQEADDAEEPGETPAEEEATTQPASQPASEPASQPASQPATKPDEKKEDKPAIEVAEFDKLALDTAYLRTQRVSRESGSEGNVAISPDGNAIYYTSGGNLKKKPWDGQASDAGSRVGVEGISPDGTTMYFTNSGKAGTQILANGKRDAVAPSDRLKVDLAEENERKFRELATTLGARFYHPTMKGLDWDGLIEKYAPLARGARTNEEFQHVSMRLLGELNGSHLGVTVPGGGGGQTQPMGQLGVRTEVEGDGFKILEVLETGPAGRGDFKLEVDDVITQLDLEPVDTSRPLEMQLVDKVGDEVIVTVQRDGEEKRLLITPVSYGQIGGLSYEAWRNERNAKVNELSGGRLGYIHIRGMDQGSLDTFERDLYAAADGKEGLVIDVRNNGGGWTTDHLLASIMYPRHAYTIPRGMQQSSEADRTTMETGGYPQDRLFIQRYNLPINMLCNEKSFSNAEIISHAFKQLGRGTLVGQETAGGVISTGAFRLVDGTTVRLPFRGWYLMDGTDMENNGAVPDILVEQTPEAEAAGEDEQLQAAVDDLLKRLDEQKQAASAE